MLAHGSGDAVIGGGVRTGELPLASDRESAWKNRFSAWALPTAESGGEGIEGSRALSSCRPFA